MADNVPKPYSFLPLVASSDKEDTSYTPETLLMKRKMYYGKDNISTPTQTEKSVIGKIILLLLHVLFPAVTFLLMLPASTITFIAAHGWCRCDNCGSMPSQL